MDPLTIFTALIPILGNIGSRIVDRFISNGKPINATEAVNMENADTQAMQAINEMDDPQYLSTWVNDVKTLERIILVNAVLIVWILMTLNVITVFPTTYDLVSNLASAAFFYMLGEHTVLNFKVFQGKK